MNGCSPGFSAIRKQSRRLAEDRAGFGKPLVQTQRVDLQRIAVNGNNVLDAQVRCGRQLPMPKNPKKSWRDRGFDILNNMYAGVALMAICAIASVLYTHYGQMWEIPIINGLITGAVVFSLFLSVRAVLSLPTATAKTTPENVGSKVLTWLHKFGLTVKSCPDEIAHDFYLIVTTDGGKKIGVYRHLTLFPDYIYVTGLLTLTDEEKRIIQELSDLEKFDALFNVQQEIWRGLFGFDSRNITTTGLTLNLRIPITENLSETAVLGAIWRMEAIIGNIMGINARAVLHHNEFKKEKPSGEQVQRGGGGQEELRGVDVQTLPLPQIADNQENAEG